MALAGEEQLDLSKKMNAGDVASVATGPMSAKIVVVVDAVMVEVDIEAAQEDVEVDLRKYK